MEMFCSEPWQTSSELRERRPRDGCRFSALLKPPVGPCGGIGGYQPARPGVLFSTTPLTMRVAWLCCGLAIP
jgi:hypothetical protein